MREGRCISLIERLKQGSELKSTLSIGKLFQRFMTRSVKTKKQNNNQQTFSRHKNSVRTRYCNMIILYNYHVKKITINCYI